MSPTLVLIRHAHVETGSRLCGWLDLPLSPEGQQQLAALARRGCHQPRPDALYTSPLRRTSTVAARLGALWHLQPTTRDALREIHCGTLEGAAIADIQRREPALWARHLAQADDAFAWPGGESYAAFRARVVTGLTAIAGSHPGQRVAVVTHSGVISQVLGLTCGRRPAAWEPDRPAPLTATTVIWSDDHPTEVVRFNDPDWY